jgi:hypothetical protein
MMQRRSTLDEALRDIEAGVLARASRIIVSRRWWDALSTAERDRYHHRAAALGVELSADELISRHFVEVVDVADEEDTPPLSSERRV